jgi:hypothetical protein
MPQYGQTQHIDRNEGNDQKMMSRCIFCGRAHGNVQYDFEICVARCLWCGHVWVTHWSDLMHNAISEEIIRVDTALAILRGPQFLLAETDKVI